MTVNETYYTKCDNCAEYATVEVPEGKGIAILKCSHCSMETITTIADLFTSRNMFKKEPNIKKTIPNIVKLRNENELMLVLLENIRLKELIKSKGYDTF